VAGRYVRDRFARHLAKLAADPSSVSPADVYTGNAEAFRAQLRQVSETSAGIHAVGRHPSQPRSVPPKQVRA